MQVLYNELVQYTAAGAALGDPVATFEGSAVLAPRGRFDIELYLSFLKLTGQVDSPARPYTIGESLCHMSTTFSLWLSTAYCC